MIVAIQPGEEVTLQRSMDGNLLIVKTRNGNTIVTTTELTVQAEILHAPHHVLVDPMKTDDTETDVVWSQSRGFKIAAEYDR